MPVDPRTPVLVAHGQVNHREAAQDNALEPVDLMAAAAREATDARVLEAIDSIRVVNVLSVHYRDPALLLGQRIGAVRFTTRYSGIGGNVPQTLVNRACADIQQGRADVVLVAGAEMWRTRTQLRANGQRLTHTGQDESVPLPEGSDENVPMAGAAEDRIRLDRPAYIYPMFEQALRVSTGESVDDHRHRIAELWARFNEVAVRNPHAWIRKSVTAEEISRPGPTNRMISWPYTKLMNSNNMVDQGAALILTSAEAATRLGIPNEQWVFPYAGTDAHDTYAISERAELHRSPAIRIGGKRVLELAGLGIDDIDYVDLYSCFPSAVQVAAAELGLPADDPARPLTVTGGLTFAGGPWNNYVAHSIATMAGLLTANPGRARVGHRQRRLPHQAQLRRVRHRTTEIGIPLGRHPIRDEQGADPHSSDGMGGRWHHRGLDDTVRPGWSAREGFPVRSHPRRTAHAGSDQRTVSRRGHCARRHRRRQGHRQRRRLRDIAMS